MIALGIQILAVKTLATDLLCFSFMTISISAAPKNK